MWPQASAKRSQKTTSRRAGRDFCFSTKGALCACQHDAHGSRGGQTHGDHRVLPAIRATTHVEGKVTLSSS
jgi:hypothetical protein